MRRCGCRGVRNRKRLLGGRGLGGGGLFWMGLEAGFCLALFDVVFDLFDFVVHDLMVGALAGTLGA